MNKNIKNKLTAFIHEINFRNYEKTDSANVDYYIRINKKYGVKFYKRKSVCQECFFRQEAAYLMGFAPKPLFSGKKKDYYFYVTEHANEGICNREKFAILRSNVKRMGWSTYDLYSHNVGMIGDKPVLLDFDNCTLGP